MEKKRSLMLTADGSHTVVLENSQVSYHSRYGAIQESQHVFIQTGLQFLLQRKPASLSILEMGLGTGLNLLLTCIALNGGSVQVSYTAFESDPLQEELIESLNYTQALQQPDLQPLFEKIHRTEWNVPILLCKELTLIKRQEDLLNATDLPLTDLIYYDAFASSAQPELWTETVFKKLAACMHADAVLVTYCSKGQVRRNLEAAGFKVEKLAGPPGKREIVRAYKQ